MSIIPQSTATSDSDAIQSAIDTAAQNGLHSVTIPRINLRTGEALYNVDKTLLIPSGVTVILDGCHMRMADGVMCNMFANSLAYDNIGLTMDGAEHDISIVGTGDALLDGGEYNRLSEWNSLKGGRPHILANTMLYFHNVERFRLENVRIINQRWWAVTFMFCRHGVIRDIDFNADYSRMDENGVHYPNEYPSSYGEIYVKNADGIDLRAGCSDVQIENITGFTEDDTVALTALNGDNFELKYRVEGSDTNIHDVAIRDVRSDCGMCANVRLLCSDGNRVYNILIDGVTDSSDPQNPWRAGATVRINDHAYYKNRPALPNEMSAITVRNVISRAVYGVSFNTAAKNVLVSNVMMHGNGAAVGNLHEGRFEDVTVEHITRIDESDAPLVKFEGCETPNLKIL